MIDTIKIKKRMDDMGIKQKDLAALLGIATPTLNLKLNNKRPIDLEQAEMIASYLKISDKQYRDYFFAW